MLVVYILMVDKTTQMLNMMYLFYFFLYLNKNLFHVPQFKKLKLGSLYHITVYLNTEKNFCSIPYCKNDIHAIKSTIV